MKEMSWYNEKRDGETKKYLEWALGVELEPEEEPGYYRPKEPTVRVRPKKVET